MTQKDQRGRELAKIHIARKDLGIDEEAYRDMLFTIARVRSAKDLDYAGRQAVLAHLKSRGFKAKHKGRPHNLDSKDRGPQMRKVEALLAEAKRPWSYADAMAKHMFHVDRVAMCAPGQLHKIIAAMMKDAQRHGRKTSSPVREPVMHWGNHEGKPIVDLPSDYLDWLIKKCNDGWVVEIAEKEYQRRSDHNEHFNTPPA